MSGYLVSEKGYGEEPWRMPTLLDGDVLVLSECGRVIWRNPERRNGTDYRSHWFCLVRDSYGGYLLLVKHGGGEERVSLGGAYRMGPVAEGMQALDSDTRYLMLHQFYSTHQDVQRSESSKYRAAFAAGRLKKKRVGGGVRVWIETPEEAAMEKRMKEDAKHCVTYR